MRARIVAALIMIPALLLSPIAQPAEPPALSVQSVAVGAGPKDGWLTQPATVLPAGGFTLATALHYASTPLRFSGQGGLQQTVVGDLGMLDVAGLVGLPHQWALGAVLPVAWLIRGGGPNLAQLDRLPQGPALGDLQLQVRKQLWQGPALGGESAFSFDATAVLPTSDVGNWLGGAPAGSLRAWWSHSIGTWRGDLGLGAQFMAAQTMKIAPLNGAGQPDAKQARTALRAGSTLDVAASLFRSLANDEWRVRGEVAIHAPTVTAVPSDIGVVDLALSGDYALLPYLRGGVVVAGAPSSGPGSAAFRVGAVLRFDPAALPSDRDGDGLDDRLDRCADQAEDRDGFEDRDGCPDLDDDGDGVPDAKDKCRLVAEDRDGFRDEDGCPDADDDGDGYADAKDLCPRAAEDRDGFQDDDGCPDLDDDGDGLADSADLCPQQPETRNGYEDQDGCPDMKPGEAPAALEPPQGPTPVVEPAPGPTPVPAAPVKPVKPVKGKKGKPAAMPAPTPADKATPAPTPAPTSAPTPTPKPAADSPAEPAAKAVPEAPAKPADDAAPAAPGKAAAKAAAAKAGAKPKAAAPADQADEEGKPRVKVKPIQ